MKRSIFFSLLGLICFCLAPPRGFCQQDPILVHDLQGLQERQAAVLKQMIERIREIELKYPAYVRKNQVAFNRIKEGQKILVSSLKHLEKQEVRESFQEQARFFSDMTHIFVEGINFLQDDDEKKSPPIGTFLNKEGAQVRYPKEKKMVLGRKPFYESENFKRAKLITHTNKENESSDPKEDSYLEATEEKLPRLFQARPDSEFVPKSKAAKSPQSAEQGGKKEGLIVRQGEGGTSHAASGAGASAGAGAASGAGASTISSGAGFSKGSGNSSGASAEPAKSGDSQASGRGASPSGSGGFIGANVPAGAGASEAASGGGTNPSGSGASRGTGAASGAGTHEAFSDSSSGSKTQPKESGDAHTSGGGASPSGSGGSTDIHSASSGVASETSSGSDSSKGAGDSDGTQTPSGAGVSQASQAGSGAGGANLSGSGDPAGTHPASGAGSGNASGASAEQAKSGDSQASGGGASPSGSGDSPPGSGGSDPANQNSGERKDLGKGSAGSNNENKMTLPKNSPVSGADSGSVKESMQTNRSQGEASSKGKDLLPILVTHSQIEQESLKENEVVSLIREWLLQERLLIQELKRYKPVKQPNNPNPPWEYYLLRQKQLLDKLKRIRRRIEMIGKKDEYFIELRQLSKNANRLLDLINRGEYTEYEAGANAYEDLLMGMEGIAPHPESVHKNIMPSRLTPEEPIPASYRQAVSRYFRDLSEG